MAGALVDRWLGAGLPPSSVTVIDPDPRGLDPTHGLRRVDRPGEATLPPSLIVLGVKPQMLAEVAATIRPALGAARPIVLSMLAGVRVQTLAGLLPDLPIVRIMPNLPVRVGKGATALFAPALDSADRAAIEALMAATGLTVPLEDESRFDAVTALSGSGPAFLFRFMEALAGAGEAAGLEAGLAQTLALQTVAGAAALAAESGLSLSVLRQQVTSPGGTTEAGLDVLDGDGALSALMRATLRASAERSRALAAAAEADMVETFPEALRA
jgi:pyrroline-5-carboxylate reductase